MDGLRANISLRVYAQKDPLVEYKNEAYDIFKVLMDRIYREVMNNLFRAQFVTYEEMQELLRNMDPALLQQNLEAFDPDGTISVTAENAWGGQEQAPVEMEAPIQVTYRRSEAKVGRSIK